MEVFRGRQSAQVNKRRLVNDLLKTDEIISGIDGVSVRDFQFSIAKKDFRRIGHRFQALIDTRR